MGNSIRAYLSECIREAPLSWRRGAIVMTVLINLALLGLLWLGIHLNNYPTSFFLLGTGIIAALDVLIVLPFKLWKANLLQISKLEGKIASLEDRLSPKIKLSLHEDPFQQTTGIEFAKGDKGQSLPYVQVVAEPATDAPIDDAIASIIRMDHRSDESSDFSEIMGETQVAGWSRQPDPAKTRLSKGKPIRCNICWYDDNGVYDAAPMRSYKLAQAYARIGKNGQYRYRLHVDGHGVVAPTEAYVYVKWRVRGHPVVTLEQITPASA